VAQTGPRIQFLEREPGLPATLQYFEGKKPQRWITGTPWENANFRIVEEATEIFLGSHLLERPVAETGHRRDE
jgi:hypothetical protein